jgi:hypothetical protein
VAADPRPYQYAGGDSRGHAHFSELRRAPDATLLDEQLDLGAGVAISEARQRGGALFAQLRGAIFHDSPLDLRHARGRRAFAR